MTSNVSLCMNLYTGRPAGSSKESKSLYVERTQTILGNASMQNSLLAACQTLQIPTGLDLFSGADFKEEI